MKRASRVRYSLTVGWCGIPGLAILVLVGAMLPARLVLAQSLAGSPRPQRDEAVELHQRVRLMEQALEEAVGRGVSVVERQLPILTSDLVFFAGSIQVRGFHLDDYGLFFDVEYPVVRRSLLWSMGALNQFDTSMARAIEDLRRRMLTMQGGTPQVTFGQAHRELEARAESPTSAAPVTQDGPDRSPIRAVSGPLPRVEPVAVDPDEVYLSALTGVLTDVLITYGGAMQLEGDEWLMIAARDGRGYRGRGRVINRRTLQIRIRGRDLAALRDGQLSPEEARARVEAR